jgi:hypothetical protein
MLRRLCSLLFVFCSLVFATPALACSCMTTEVDPQAYLRKADLVFEGEVLSTPLTSWFRNTVTFRVLSPMKGRLGEKVTLDQTLGGMCMEVFAAGERVRVAAYGNAQDGYGTSACSQLHLYPEFQGAEIWDLATANRARTLALGGADLSAADAATLRRLIQWHADYESFEEGLDAADRLLVLAPQDPDGLRFKEQFLSALKGRTWRLPAAD